MHEFYSKILGESRFNAPNGPYDEFLAENAIVSIFDRSEMLKAINLEKTTQPSRFENIVVIFQVPDVDEVYETLKAKGITFINEPIDRPDWMIRTVHALDPDGNIIEFNHQLSQS